MDDRLQELIEEIRRDNISGAVPLTLKGAQVLVEYIDITKRDSPSSFLAELHQLGRTLIQAQPAMASFFNLVNRVLWRLEGLTELQAMKEAVREGAEAFAAELTRQGECIAQAVLPLIGEGATIMTHSYSSTVLKGLLVARGEGRRMRVICLEGRPMREGVTLAQELGQAGIEVTLIVDAAGPQMMEEAQLVLVGADSLSPLGLVNKVGTYALALAARAHRVPFYALCGSEKFLPADWLPHMAAEVGGAASEILPEPVRNVSVLNRYFDLTPLPYLCAVITERGIMGPAEVKEALAELKVHPSLL